MNAAKERVAVLGTGGSVATLGRDRLDLMDYDSFGTMLSLGSLLDLFPEIRELFEVFPVDYRVVSSTKISPPDWVNMVGRIHALVHGDPGLAGIVITHGTSTLEETAYFLDLTLKTSVTVVVCGAQRPPNGLITDAGMNILNSMRVAASREARDMGVLVVMNDEIHTARDVTKASTYGLGAFASRDAGPIGHVAPNGDVRVYRRPTRPNVPHTEFRVDPSQELPRVEVAYSYAGADGMAIRAITSMSAAPAAIVSAGMAPGVVTPGEDEALRAACAAGIVVVQSSRAGSGRVLQHHKSVGPGFVAGDNLTPQKARILVMLALTVTRSLPDIQEMFDRY